MKHIFSILLGLTFSQCYSQCEITKTTLENKSKINSNAHEEIESLEAIMTFISLFTVEYEDLSKTYGLSIRAGFMGHLGAVPREITLFFSDNVQYTIKADILNTNKTKSSSDHIYELLFPLNANILSAIRTKKLLTIEVNDYKQVLKRDINIKYAKILQDQLKCLE